MRHINCYGKIIEKLLTNQETLELECLQCGKVWGVSSDFSDMQSDYLWADERRNLLGFEFKKFSMRARLPNSIINYLFNDRLRRLAKMIDSHRRKKYVGLDIGCGTGYFTQYLAQKFSGITVGIDVSKKDLSRAKIRTRLNTGSEKSTNYRDPEFVQSTITHMPFREASIDLVFCASVLEHIKDLDVALKEVKFSMKNKANLIAGYPIEGRLFMFLLKVFLPLGLNIRDPKVLGKEQFEKSPETHKQKFTEIRTLLLKYFVREKCEKSFFTFLPDKLSWYECAKMSKQRGKVLR